MNPSESVDRLVVAIDFGTTYSGVAYSYSATPPERPDDIIIIKKWPGANAIVSDKVPSELTYGPSAPVSRASSVRSEPDGSSSRRGGSRTGGNAIFNFTSLGAAVNGVASANGAGPADQIRWGFQLQPDENKLKCLKLFLQDGLQIPSYVSKRDMRHQLDRAGKDVTTAVADYLTELFKHAKQALVKQFGEYFVRTTHLEVIVTVPAIWTDGAKNATLKAAEKAGMGNNIRMISEPEAAAVYTLQAIRPNHLKVGDNFIVCDAGGGTVDLISYEIKQTTPLRIEETVRGTGSCCGAAFLNIRFEEYVRKKLGSESFRVIRERQPRSWLTALNHFEQFVKRNYDPVDRIDFHIPFPGVEDNAAAGIEQGFLSMSSDSVGELFKPIMAEIISLVEGQMHRLQDLGKTVKAIVLVGGFGQSSCLYKCLQQKFADEAPPPSYSDSISQRSRGSETDSRFEIMQPANAWTAVARGALLRGLEGVDIVLSRRSRRHYGTKNTSAFKSNLHSRSERYWCKLEEEWRVDNRMTWFIKKDQKCSSSEPTLLPFYANYADGTGYTQVCELMVCEDDLAPEKYTEGSTYVNCKLVVNLESVPSRFWKQRTNSKGTSYKKLDFVLGMQIESGGLRFDLRVDDVVYGDVIIDFDSA